MSEPLRNTEPRNSTFLLKFTALEHEGIFMLAYKNEYEYVSEFIRNAIADVAERSDEPELAQLLRMRSARGNRKNANYFDRQMAKNIIEDAETSLE